jgi:hypothetical protein
LSSFLPSTPLNDKRRHDYYAKQRNGDTGK